MNEKPSQGGSYIKDSKGKLKLVARTQPESTAKKQANKVEDKGASK